MRTGQSLLAEAARRLAHATWGPLGVAERGAEILAEVLRHGLLQPAIFDARPDSQENQAVLAAINASATC